MADYYPFTPDLPYGMTDDRPSGLRVLAKSLHLLALGWIVSVVWLWSAQIEVNVRRFGADNYGSNTLIEGAFPALLIELMAMAVSAMIARVPGIADSRREWWHAFVWTIFPNAMLLGTAYLMITAGR
jgi:hypothetical protein